MNSGFLQRQWLTRGAIAAAAVCLSVIMSPVIVVEALAAESGVAEGGAVEGEGIGYLNALKGALPRYKAPSELDARYNIALYVNTATSGAHKQRMWVLQRDGEGGPWRLAMWDKDYWAANGAAFDLAPGEEPPFSWLVSTGKYWRGERSGPTPIGVFNLDERKGRLRRGWYNDRIKHIAYIDLHYSSGRRSGIAFHGTPKREYKRLGTIASHGCIRMRQENALAVLSRITGWDGVLDKPRRWGEVPRFWRRQRRGTRVGYVRDGRLLAAPLSRKSKGRRARIAAKAARAAKARAEARVKLAAAKPETHLLSDARSGTLIAPSPPAAVPPAPLPVLTKVGYRTLAVFFKHSGE